MQPFIPKKVLDIETLSSLLQPAQQSNHWTNEGYCSFLLEELARDMLQIDSNKSIIAVSSGTAALHIAIDVVRSVMIPKATVATQNFTFASNWVGSMKDSLILDLDRGNTVDFRHKQGQYDVLVVTNCFGLTQDIDFILDNHSNKNQLIVFDNAAAPYSFYSSAVTNQEFTNSCNLGFASAISLHHTKPIGFGEGGLLIIDKEYERYARASKNIGLINGKFVINNANNYKISELNAAGIIQWWKQFDIEDLCDMYLSNYYKLKSRLSKNPGRLMHNHSARFLPSCLPWIGTPDNTLNVETKKYYKPIQTKRDISNKIYDNITCYPIYNGIQYNG